MTSRFIPRSDYLLVRLSEPAKQSKGGIALPDSAARTETEGKVVAVGPGAALDGGTVAFPWFLPGDVVLFAAHNFRRLADRDGLVSSRDVVATVGPENELLPENDYCLLKPDRAPEESAGGIVLPERGRKAARSGVLLNAGPGLPVATGPLAGTCKPVWASLNVPREWVAARWRVWWSADAMALHAAGQVLVRAADLLFWEEPDLIGGM